MRSHNLNYLLLLTLLVGLGGVVCPVQAQVGFQAELHTPPSPVSRWQEPDEEYSVAIGSRSLPFKPSKIKIAPKVVSASFEHQTLTFNSEVHRYRQSGRTLDMVPVSVDRHSFQSYRTGFLNEQNLLKQLRKNMADPDRDKNTAGLGITIGLPKRLDRVFGEGGAGLNVSGYRRISFSGRSQWTDGQSNDAYQASKFPTLNMEQISNFSITGTIGTKISVKVSQDSRQADIPLSNRIEIRYKGDEDDILKSIEAGNTTLNLPNTRFVGYSSRIRGLFGIKAAAQVGSLKLTAIASQEKGSTDRASVSPTGEESAEFIRDYEYARDRIFDLGLPGELNPGDIVTNLWVYEQVNRDNDLEADVARLHVNPNDPTQNKSEGITGVKVKRLEDERYELVNDPERIPYLVFTGRSGTNRAVGIYLEVKRGGSEVIDTIGNITSSTTDTLDLKLLRHNAPRPDHVSWGLMWRNCYTIPRGMTVEDLNINIYKGLAGNETNQNLIFDVQEDLAGQTQYYLEILGLDRYNTRNELKADGRVDERLEIFRPDWGLLIFPRRQPFNTDSTFSDVDGRATQPLQLKVSDIYINTWESQARIDASQYFLSLATKSRSAIIKLNKPNIIEHSERVLVNGELLTRGADYRIDYGFGQITLLSDKATDPNADIEIDYEFAPFFAVQKKTLLGMRAEYEWSKNFSFGGTVLYKSDKAQERKPKVGDETAKMVVYDLDASLSLQPNFLSKVVDALPLVETESNSRLSLSGEIAQSHPNPNVEGQAWVDDFEAALDILSLGKTRVVWQESSPPLQLGEIADPYLRGRILWHQPRHVVRVDDVYDRDAAQGEGTIRTFRMIFRPKHQDTVITVDEAGDSLIVEEVGGVHKSWGGLTRYFGSRVDAKRAQLFEIRMRGQPQAKLHFDFGNISEDTDADDNPDSEDNNLNGAIEDGEDTGLDGKADPIEPGYHPLLNPDPNHDNWWFPGENAGCPPVPRDLCDQIDPADPPDSLIYEFLNGTENNSDDISILGRPDREQLSQNGYKDDNAYFSYAIDFSTDSFFVQGTEKNGWRTYRIPIRDTLALAGEFSDDATIRPRWDQISHVRVWFEAEEDQEKSDTVEVAEWGFIQMNWQDTVVYSELNRRLDAEEKTKFIVASISQEDNTFSPPPGVEAYTDPTTNTTEAQRGLLLEFANFNHYDTCVAVKSMSMVDKYSGYRRMEMYVHGDTSAVTLPDGRQQIRFFLRIGKDSANFYEYRTDVYPGWAPQNHVNIDFNEATAIKDSLIRLAQEAGEREIDGVREPYRIFGYPNLNEIRYFAAGLINVNESDTLSGPSGAVWLDELRVTDVRRDVGTAARFSANGTLADLITYSFTYQNQDPYFRQVSQATRGGGDNNLGSGNDKTAFNYNLSMNVDKFLPTSWKASIPVQYSYAKNTTTPLLRNNSDIVLSEERRVEEQSISENRSISVSESFRNPGGGILFKGLLNRQSVRVSYRRTSSRSVNQPYSFGENLSVKTSLDLNIKGMPTIPIFFWTKPIPLAKKASESRLGIYPTKFTLSADYSRNAQVSDDKTYNRRSSLKRDFNGRLDMSYNVFEALKLGFNYNTRRDLSDMNLVNISFKDLRLGQELHYQQSFTGSYDPNLFTFFTASFGFKSSYSDDWEHSTESRKSSLNQSWNVKGQFDHNKLFRNNKRGGGGRPGGGTRSNVRGGGQKKEEGRPLYDYPLALMRFLTGWIKPPDYSYSQDFQSSIPGMLQRPSLKYRFGMTRTAGVDTVSQSRSMTSSEGVKYSGSTGFTLLGGLTTDVKYSKSIGRDLVKQGSRQEQESENWPDLSIRIAQFRTLPIIKPVVNKLIEVFAPRTSYSRSTRKTTNLESGNLTSKSVSISYQPLLSINFNLFRKLSLSASYNRSNDRGEKSNPSSGKLEKITRSSKKSISFTSNYSFSAPSGIGIPLFGKLKFKSTVQLQLNVKLNSQITETKSGNQPFVTSNDKTDFTWSTSVKYGFSRQISGGMDTRWQDSNDNYRKRKSHVREVRLWVELKF